MALLRSSVCLLFRRSFCVHAFSPTPIATLPMVKHNANQLGSDDNLFQSEEHSTGKNLVVCIVNALRLGNREKASTLLWNHMSKSITSEVDQFTRILQFCASSPDPLFAMETLKFMEENSILLDNRCWSYIIKSLSDGGHLKEALSLLGSLGDTDRATIPMFNLYLSGCIRSKNLSQASEGLQLMECQFLGKSEATYLLLLELAVCQKNLSLVYNISRDFHRFYPPSVTSVDKFIWAYSKLGDFKSASSALRHMVTLVTEESAPKFPSAGHFSCRLDIPIPSNVGLSREDTSEVSSVQLFCSTKNTEHNYASDSKTTELYDVQSASCGNNNMLPYSGNHLSAAGRTLLQRSFHHLLRGCVKRKNHDLSKQLFSQMSDLGLEPSASSYDAFVRAIVPEKGVAYGIKIIETMMERNLKPFDTTVGALIVEHCKALEFELAEERLCQIDRKSLFLCNALLDAYHEVGRPERALWLLKRMRQWNIKPDTKTYELLFLLFGKFNNPYEVGDDFSRAEVKKRIHAIETNMIRNGVGHTSFTLENLIKVVGSEGMTEEVLRYLTMAEALFSSSYPGTITYNVALHAHVLTRESNVAVGLFNKMRSYSIPLDAATYHIMLDCCSILKSYKFALALVSYMLRDGYLPTALTYFTLIKTTLASQDFDEVLKLLDQMLAEGLEPDAHLFNTIVLEAAMMAKNTIQESAKASPQKTTTGLDLLPNNGVSPRKTSRRTKGYLDIMELMLEQMHRLRIPPNPSICANAFLAYATHDLPTTALECLQVLSMRMISEDEDVLEIQRATYEDLLYREDEETAADKFLVDIFLNSGEALGTALMNLRWCVILGMDVTWRPEESPWAKRLAASQYSSRCG